MLFSCASYKNEGKEWKFLRSTGYCRRRKSGISYLRKVPTSERVLRATITMKWLTDGVVVGFGRAWEWTEEGRMMRDADLTSISNDTLNFANPENWVLLLKGTFRPLT